MVRNAWVELETLIVERVTEGVPKGVLCPTVAVGIRRAAAFAGLVSRRSVRGSRRGIGALLAFPGVLWCAGPALLLLRIRLCCASGSMLANQILLADQSLDTGRLASRRSVYEWQTTGRSGWRVARDGLWLAIRRNVLVERGRVDRLRQQK